MIILSSWMRRKILHNNSNALIRNLSPFQAVSPICRIHDDSRSSKQEQSVPQKQQQQYMISPALKLKSDLVVVLDMDECMIHSQFLTSDEYDFRQHDLQTSRNNKNSNGKVGSGEQHERSWSRVPGEAVDSVESFSITLPDNDVVMVNKRPYLDTFLSELSQRFETHVFTAAMEVYASPVLDALDPLDTIFSHRFYREHCILDDGMGVYVKNLESVLPFGSATKVNTRTQCHRQLIYDEKRIVLIDNNPMSFLANPRNGILVSNFYDDKNDKALLSVLSLLDELDEVEDVRPVLEDLFGLTDALQDIVAQRQRE